MSLNLQGWQDEISRRGDSTYDLCSRISRARYEVLKISSKPPRVLYVGHREWELLNREFQRNCTFACEVIFPEGHSGFEWQGMEVIRVLRESYLAATP